MARHSKSNQIREFVTYEERARWVDIGTQSVRLGSDSMRSFDSCCLCTQFAQDPTATPAGYLYCKICIYENIVEQRKSYERRRAEFDEEHAKAESTQESLRQMHENITTEMFMEAHDGLLPCGRAKVATLRDHKARAIDELRHAGTKKPVSQSFWIPQHTPQAAKSTPAAPPECKIVDPMDASLVLKVRQLVRCRFTEQRELAQVRDRLGEGATKANIKEGKYQCPSCSRTLSNSVKLGVLPKCGHVICLSCIDKFMTPSSTSTTTSSEESGGGEEPAKKRSKAGSQEYACVVCATVSADKDIIRLKPPGTGFCGALEDPTKQVAKRYESGGGFAAATDFTNAGASRKVTYRI